MKNFAIFIFIFLLLTLIVSSGCTKTDLHSSNVPCKGVYYGSDIPPYKQKEICREVCHLYDSNYYNSHCFDYLKCSCVRRPNVKDIKYPSVKLDNKNYSPWNSSEKIENTTVGPFHLNHEDCNASSSLRCQAAIMIDDTFTIWIKNTKGYTLTDVRIFNEQCQSETVSQMLNNNSYKFIMNCSGGGSKGIYNLSYRDTGIRFHTELKLT